MRVLPVLIAVAGAVCAGAGFVVEPAPPGTIAIAIGDFHGGSPTVRLTETEPWRTPLADALVALGAGATGAAASVLVLRRARPPRGGVRG